MFDSNVNMIFLGTDGAASSQVGQILPLRVEGSVPYSAPLINHDHVQYLLKIVNTIMSHKVLRYFGNGSLNLTTDCYNYGISCEPQKQSSDHN